jgi:ABC-type sugar transport system permease subunit
MQRATSRRQSKWIIPLFLLPSILLYTLFFIYPSIDAFRIATYDWSGFGDKNMKYIGLQNFLEAVRDPFVRSSLANNLIIMVPGGILLFALALYFAVVLTHPRFKGKRLLRTILFFPYVINEVGVAFLWLFILNPQFGLLNGTLEAIGLESLALPWLGQRNLAMAAIIWVIIWMDIGFYTILLQAGIDNIPQDLFDAAKVDGARGFSLFRHITWPLLRDVLAVAVTFWMIQALKVFGIIYAMTRGAPAGGTHSVATYMYAIAMPWAQAIFRFGYGTSIAVLSFIIIVGLSALFFRFIRREAVEF